MSYSENYCLSHYQIICYFVIRLYRCEKHKKLNLGILSTTRQFVSLQLHYGLGQLNLVHKKGPFLSCHFLCPFVAFAFNGKNFVNTFLFFLFHICVPPKKLCSNRSCSFFLLLFVTIFGWTGIRSLLIKHDLLPRVCVTRIGQINMTCHVLSCYVLQR